MYGKIFDRVFTGSMYGSGPVVFAVWAYVIANTRPPGVAELNPKHLASCIGTSTEEIRDAIEFLCRPDPESQNPDEEGRRLVLLAGMEYRVVSFEKYQKLRTFEDRREYHREYWHKRKSQRLNSNSTDSTLLNSTQQPSTESTHRDRDIKTPPNPRKRGNSGLAHFDRFWGAYPKKVSKGQAERAFSKLSPDEPLVCRMVEAVERAKTSEQWRKEGGKFIPHPATWLGARGWEDGDASPIGMVAETPEWLKDLR